MLIKGFVISGLLVTGRHISLSGDDSLAIVSRDGIGKDDFKLKGCMRKQVRKRRRKLCMLVQF